MKKTVCALMVLALLVSGCDQATGGKNDAENESSGTESVTPETGTDGGGDDTAPDDGAPGDSDTGDDGDEDSGGDEPSAKLESILVTVLPTRTEYQIGDVVDFTGLEVSGHWSDGSVTICAPESYTLSAVDTSVSGKKTVTIGIDGFSAFFPVFVYSADNLIAITGGAFDMGCDTDSSTDNPVHRVCVNSFLIGRYEVTYAQWNGVYAWATEESLFPYTFANAGQEGNAGTIGTAPTEKSAEPVTYINWLDAAIWCNALSEMNGVPPAYYEDASCTVVLRSSKAKISPVIDPLSIGYRLPTEAEWEFAAGGGDGARTTYSGTDDSTMLPDYAWYYKNSAIDGEKKTWPVGGKLPNSCGVNDLSGNVAEWCQDWFDDSWYRISPTDNPMGPTTAISEDNPLRVQRGGAYSGSLWLLAVSARKSAKHTSRSGSLGFRVARNVE